ncbi:MAG: hypothetical protein ACTSR8_21675 [Promethearchaeota archaeon]
MVKEATYKLFNQYLALSKLLSKSNVDIVRELSFHLADMIFEKFMLSKLKEKNSKYNKKGFPPKLQDFKIQFGSSIHLDSNFYAEVSRFHELRNKLQHDISTLQLALRENYIEDYIHLLEKLFKSFQSFKSIPVDLGIREKGKVQLSDEKYKRILDRLKDFNSKIEDSISLNYENRLGFIKYAFQQIQELPLEVIQRIQNWFPHAYSRYFIDSNNQLKIIDYIIEKKNMVNGPLPESFSYLRERKWNKSGSALVDLIEQSFALSPELSKLIAIKLFPKLYGFIDLRKIKRSLRKIIGGYFKAGYQGVICLIVKDQLENIQELQKIAPYEDLQIKRMNDYEFEVNIIFSDKNIFDYHRGFQQLVSYIQSFSQQLFEIIEQNYNKENDNFQLERSLLRLQDLKKHKNLIDNRADQLRRGINLQIDLPFSLTGPAFLLIEQLEKIGDTLYNICEEYLKYKTIHKEEIVFFNYFNQKFEEFSLLFPSSDKEVNRKEEENQEFFEKLDYALEINLRTPRNLIANYINSMLFILKNINGALIALRIGA